MNLSAPFIRRPIATSLLAAALLMAGAAAFTQLAVAPLPRIDLPTISVSTALPGAAPETMATSVAMPLERRFGRIAGVSEITSVSALGSTSVTIQFDLSRDVEAAARDVQAAINAAGGDLPPNLPTRPNIRKVNPADSPVLILTLRSKSIPLQNVFEAANTVLAQKISQVEGVGQVGVGGGVQPAVRVQIDPANLAGMGLSLEDIRNSLSTATADQPKGAVGAAQWKAIGVDDQLLNAAAWGNVIVHWTPPSTAVPTLANPPAPTGVVLNEGTGTGDVASVLGINATAVVNTGTSGGASNATSAPGDSVAASSAPANQSTVVSDAVAIPSNVTTIASAALTPTDQSETGFAATGGGAVRLSDIATVTDDVENRRVAGWYDGDRTVMVIIRRQPGANILDVIAKVKALLPQLALAIPPGIDVQIALDRAGTIRASVHDVEHTLLISIMLVVIVVFVFLRSARATAVPSVAVPLSLVATFGVMYMLNYSLDNLSLMAMTIATGFVVDDAIVVTENITRFMEGGMSRFQAALEGSRQIGFTIVSITCSLLAVFIPLLYMPGAVGRLFREFAVTLAIAITLSALISLTLTPMMCSKLLTAHEGKPGYIGGLLDRGLNGLIRGYGHALRFVLRHRVIAGIFTMCTIAGTLWLYTVVPKGTFPQQDTGLIVGSSLGPEDISYPAMKARQEALNAVVQADKDVAHVISNVGGFGASSGNGGSLYIVLKDLGERKDGIDEVIARLRKETAKVPGILFYPSAVQDVRLGGRSSRSQYQYVLQDANLAELNQWAPKVLAAMKKIKLIKDVNSDQQTNGLQLDVEIDRDTAARFGITAAAIDNTLYDAFGQRQIAVFYTEVNQYHVVMEVNPDVQQSPADLDHIFITSGLGTQVPLSALVKVTPVPVSLSIGHQSQFAAVTMSFNLPVGGTQAPAEAAIEKATASIGLPPSVQAALAGTAKAFDETVSGEVKLLILAFVCVYLVLGILYESYVHPITILSTIFSAGLGALLALMITGSPLDLIAIVGIILLIGIVKKNAILMVDFALDLEREGKPKEEAIYEAATLRFRPILMTTLAALLGAVPLAFGGGTGSELRRPLGIAIVGGLAVSQMLTLFTTPVVYLALHRFTRKKKAQPLAPGEHIPPPPSVGPLSPVAQQGLQQGS